MARYNSRIPETELKPAWKLGFRDPGIARLGNLLVARLVTRKRDDLKIKLAGFNSYQSVYLLVSRHTGAAMTLILSDIRTSDEPTETTVNRSKTSCNRMAYFGLPTRPRWPCVGVLVRWVIGMPKSRRNLRRVSRGYHSQRAYLAIVASTVRCGPRRRCGRATCPLVLPHRPATPACLRPSWCPSQPRHTRHSEPCYRAPQPL